MAIINYNKTKIIATYGPSTSDAKTIESMVKLGVDVFRFNFSHGDHAFHLDGMKKVVEFNRKHGTHIATLADLQGPKNRVGEVENDSVMLHNDSEFILTSIKQISNANKVYVSYDEIGNDVKVGEDILIDDGKIRITTIEIIDKDSIKVKVIDGGELKPKKGVNFPNTDTSVSSITEKDKKDLQFALDNGANWIALSFVRNADDIRLLKSLIGEKMKEYTKIIAKIEKPEAIKNIDEIIAEADAIMVARGDLAIEIPFQKVPVLQKEIVEKCNIKGKPVVVATQIMESMTTNSFPTRAEISDAANAVMDGADALMLSGETSIGTNPEKVIETISQIIHNVENQSDIYYTHPYKSPKTNPDYASDAVCYTATFLADSLKAKAIVGMTRSGYTGFRISSYRPKSRVFIFSDNRPLLYTMNLIWGVKGLYYDGFGGTDQTIQDVIDILEEKKLVAKGDIVINTASMPFSERSKTNTVKVTVVK